MIQIQGTSVFGGIAIGTIEVLKKKENYIRHYSVENTESEVNRYREATVRAELLLEELYEKAVEEVGETDASVFRVHKLMLSDVEYVDRIESLIREHKVNAEFAVASVCHHFEEMFKSLDDDYMQARMADVQDISERLIYILSEYRDPEKDDRGARIILAENLSPSETVQLNKNNVLALVTRYGSSNSHTSIIARMMNIPAVIGVDFPKNCDGKLAIVDGFTGNLYIEPDRELLDIMEKKRKSNEYKKDDLHTLKGKEDVMLSGKKIHLYANVGNVEDVITALENDASGIGLFRSEFLYLEKDHFPTEEEQFVVYKRVAQMMAGKKVIIRTMDIGADKCKDYMELGAENNPAMGYRGIRICLDRPELLKTQLRAIYRASTYGNIALMYPMITSVEEIRKIKYISNEVKESLKKEGILINDVEEGIMIETPAAAIISDLLAKEVDFFSVGTNDLTQFTLAMDRQNRKLENCFNPCHESVLRLIQMTVRNAHEAGIWVGVCGELGADPRLTEHFIQMGVDELSVAPVMILPLRKIIREIQ